MTLARWIFAATLIVPLGACSSSAPLHYYTLEVVRPVSAAPAAPPAMLLHVRHISVPPEIDHRGLTHGPAATQLVISDSDQWSAPLPTLIQAAVSQDLGERVGYEHVVAPGAQPVGVALALDLDFLTLSADAGCNVSAQVNWTLSGAAAAPRRGSVHLSAAASGCPGGLPAALSAALGDLADQLARILTTP